MLMGDLDNCCALRWHKYFCRLHFGPRGRAFAKVKKIGKDFNFFSLIICFWLGTFLDRMCMECIADGMMSNWKYSHTLFDTHIMTLWLCFFFPLQRYPKRTIFLVVFRHCFERKIEKEFWQCVNQQQQPPFRWNLITLTLQFVRLVCNPKKFTTNFLTLNKNSMK